MVISAISNTNLRNYRTDAAKARNGANRLGYVTFRPPSGDVFVKQSVLHVSFKGYDRAATEKFIEQIEQSKIRPLDSGWQSEFYKINGEIGIKSPKPLHPEYPNADFYGHGNIKEFFALKKSMKFRLILQ